MSLNYSAFLRQVPLFADLPDSDLKQICQYVHEVNLPAGEMLFYEGHIGKHAFVIVEGQVEIFKVANGQKVQLAIRQPGEVIGEMSLLEETPRNASGKALTDTVAIAIKRDQIDQLLSTNPSAARTMLHTVIMRLQSTQANLLQTEKMAQLGTFTAGIAHEINNPSAAVQRGAEQLKKTLDGYIENHSDLRVALVTQEHLANYRALREEIHRRVKSPAVMDAGTRMDQEAALENWLAEAGLEEHWEVIPYLLDLGYDPAALRELAEGFPPNSHLALLKWIAAESETRQLVEEIHQGAGRISEIIKALKSYSYLDQAPNQEIDVHEGLEDTLVILRHKLKHGIEVVRAYDRSIPPISAYGSELNQVWTNLIDNAIDAMDGKGRIILRTAYKDSWVKVTIEDNGPGIPPEVQQKLFYPFFTTKPVGKGTGLGLNISHRIVQKHGGSIQVFSQPGQTRFEVRLPVGESSWQPQDNRWQQNVD